MSQVFAAVNGLILPSDRASLQISDLSIQRGFGVFDFFKTLNYKPIFLEEHLDRFFRSAAGLRLEVGKTREELRALIALLQEKNQLAYSGFRLTLTGGYATDSITPATPNLVISQMPLPGAISEKVQPSIRLVGYPHRRQLPEVKSIDYLMAIWLQPYIRECGADEVLYHQEDGSIAECPRSNFFMVTADDVVVTPARGILPGIIRGKVLELARQQFAVEVRDVTLSELSEAKEAFITSTTKQILPVAQVDGVEFGEAGPVARLLNAELYALCHDVRI
jgi:branched-chain amino acid aminotransferase